MSLACQCVNQPGRGPLKGISPRILQILSWMMIVRGFYGCARCRSSLHVKWQTHRSRIIRSYTTSSATTAWPIAQSPTSILGTLTIELDKISPRFELHSSQIRILKSPVDFYEALKVGSFLCNPAL